MGRDWAAAVWGSFIPIPWQRRPFHRYSRRASNTSQLCIDSWRYEPDRDARRTLTIPEEHSILVPHGPGSAKAREEAEWHLARLASSRVRDICVGGLYSSSDQGGGAALKMYRRLRRAACCLPVVAAAAVFEAMPLKCRRAVDAARPPPRRPPPPPQLCAPTLHPPAPVSSSYVYSKRHKKQRPGGDQRAVLRCLV